MPLLPLADTSHAGSVPLFAYVAAVDTVAGESWFPVVPYTQVVFFHVLTAAAVTANPADLCVPRIQYRFHEADAWVDLCTFPLYQSSALPAFPQFEGWQNDIRVARRRFFDAVVSHVALRAALAPSASRFNNIHPSVPQVRGQAFITNASGTADFTGAFFALPTAARQSRGPRRRHKLLTGEDS